MTFHQIAKDARLQRRLGLRQFCENAGLDASNWSKIERGITPPPKDERTLESVAKHLGLVGRSMQEFLDAASVARSELPKDISSDEVLASKLPAFFRAMRGSDPSEEQLLEMISDIKGLHQSQNH